MNFLENGRGGFYLLHGGLKYSARTKRNDRAKWRSVDRKNPATVVKVWRPHHHDEDFISVAVTVDSSSLE